MFYFVIAYLAIQFIITSCRFDFFSIDKNVIVDGNLLPNPDNLRTLGNIDNRWSEIFIGPGTLNLFGPSLTKFAAISADNNAIAYTETGLATPYINIGPEQLTPYAVGGWQIPVR